MPRQSSHKAGYVELFQHYKDRHIPFITQAFYQLFCIIFICYIT